LFHRLVNSTSTALDTAREVLTPTELGAVRLNQWVIRGGAGGLYTPLRAGAGSLTASTGAPRPRLRHTREPRRPTWARTGSHHRYLERSRESRRPARVGALAGAGAHGCSTTPTSGARGSRCGQHAWEPHLERAHPQLRRTHNHRLELRRPRANPVVGGASESPCSPSPL
jgi:hypothetical protein